MSEHKTTRKHLYGLCGVMQKDNHADVLLGCVLAVSADEARGNHVRWMQGKMPGYAVHSVNVFLIPDDLVAQAAQEAVNGKQ